MNNPPDFLAKTSRPTLELLARILHGYLYADRYQDVVSIAFYKKKGNLAEKHPHHKSTACFYGCNMPDTGRKVVISIDHPQGLSRYFFHETCYFALLSQAFTSEN